jgi:hypothetical protein
MHNRHTDTSEDFTAMTVPNRETVGALRARMYTGASREDYRISRELFSAFEKLMTTDPKRTGLPPDAFPRHLAMAAVEFGLSSFAMWVAMEQGLAQPDGGR